MARPPLSSRWIAGLRMARPGEPGGQTNEYSFMSGKNIEIEIQVKVDNSRALLEFLKSKADHISEKHQVDYYFSPKEHNFLKHRPVTEWLRLRNDNGKCTINYKNWHLDKDGKSHYCDEYETEIKDIDQARRILTALSFKSVVTVDKVRQTWKYQDYEIGIDSVKNLGDFVEVEYIGQDGSIEPRQATDAMVEFLKQAGCGRVMRNFVGYPFQLLFPDEVKFEEQ